MNGRAAHSDRMAGWLLLPALLAVVPAIQFCPLTPAQAGTAGFYRCLILDMPAAVAKAGARRSAGVCNGQVPAKCPVKCRANAAARWERSRPVSRR